MMLEHALLHVRDDETGRFENSMKEALPIIESAHGCSGASLRRQAEDPSVYLLLVQWSSIAAHMSFRESDRFSQWRALTHPFYLEPPVVTHFFEPLER